MVHTTVHHVHPVPCPCCQGDGTVDSAPAQRLLTARSRVDSATDCWLWVGWRFPNSGYGRVGLDNHTWLTHRLSFLSFGGSLSAEKPLVRHSCDRPPCLNPLHLSAGDTLDNARDRQARGRGPGSRTVEPIIDAGDRPTVPEWAPIRTACSCCSGTGLADATAWLSHLEAKSAPADGGCRIWTGRLDKYGYGTTRLLPHRFTAHRLAVIASGRKIPRGMVVRHRCNTPACVEPSHVAPGTAVENMRDRHERGLYGLNHGSRNGGARLTSAQVTAIRLRRLAGARLSSLTEEFGISEATLVRLVKGKSWAKQDADVLAQLATTERHRPGKAARFTVVDRECMHELREAGHTLDDIAARYGVTQRTIRLYLGGQIAPLQVSSM